MDTTETYIKMADDPDIQGLYTRDDRLNPKNFAYCKTHDTLVKEIFGDYECGECPVEWTVGDSIDGWIVLPRQDQLQEMVEGQLRDKFDRFDVWCHSKTGFPGAWSDWTLQFTSVEQLWLAFVMKEKYNKVWDGDKWIIRN